MEVTKAFIDKECDEKGNQKVNSLNNIQKEGLKSLSKRVKNEEVVILKTDKSHKLCILGIEKYREMGQKHTDKDREVTWDDVMLRQRKVTGLVRSLK